MGASNWFYRIDYDDDVQGALDRLHQQVFDRGAFVFEPDFEILELGGMANQDPEAFARLQGGDAPRSPDEAVTWSAPNGTHSILDIAVVDERRDFGVAWRLGHDAIRGLFGTETPDTDVVELLLPEVDPMSLGVDRWQGVYVTGYRDGRPDSLFFIGFSGD